MLRLYDGISPADSLESRNGSVHRVLFGNHWVMQVFNSMGELTHEPLHNSVYGRSERARHIALWDSRQCARRGWQLPRIRFFVGSGTLRCSITI
jgi:hypothetical protein